jgi:CheY-like chemotaxis protein
MTFTPHNITQRGRDLLTLIRISGKKGINRAELATTLKHRLENVEYAQLNLLEAAGFITVEILNLVGNPNVEFVYRQTVPNNPAIQILIVDDREIMRRGLTALFADYGDLTLMGEAANGQEAIDFCALAQPDIILMDLGLPVLDGITATALIRKAYPLIKVLIFSDSKDVAQIKKGLESGAIGFIRKNISGKALVVVIRATMIKDD